MKRLLVLMMCVMLAVPAVGMNANAAGTGTISEEIVKTEQQKADELAKDNASVLNKHYEEKQFQDSEKEKADAIMQEASGKLGLKFDSQNGKLSDDESKETELKTENEVTEYVKKVKAELDECKAKGSNSENNDIETKSSSKDKADKQARDEAIFLSNYYSEQKYTKDEKVEADAIMQEAAEKLGLIFDEKTGKLSDNPDKKTEFEYKSNVIDYVDEIKKKLAECKTSVAEPEAPSTPSVPSEPEEIDVNSNIIIGGKEYDTTIANAGQHCEIAVPLVNLGDTKVTNVVITPALSSDPTVWPFDIEKTDYSQVCEKLYGEDSGKDVLDRKHTFRWTLRTRDDAITGYTKLTFNVSYNEADGTKGSVALDYYVQVNGVEPEDENRKLSTPRVIVTGFTTTPEEVYAGDTFKLTLNLKNTSKETAVSNMLFDIQGTQEGTDANNTYAAFLPTAGSSTIFVDSIGPNATKSISIELKSKADLAQKPYVVTVNMEYEDSKANPFSETASVSVPIKQEAKVDLSSIQAMPDAIDVGNEANVMFSIYNVGKTKLYNVNVKFAADSISGGDVFIGNMDPGATGNVDAYLMGQAATMDDGTVKIIISYEDEEGKEATIEKTMTLFVNEPFYPDMMEDPMMEGMEEQKSGLPWWGYVIIGVAVVGAAAAAIFVIKKKKKAKKLAQEEMELIDSLEDNE